MLLFDTTFVLDLSRSESGAVRLAEETVAGSQTAAISVVSAYEYLLGVHNKFGAESDEKLQGRLALAKSQIEKFEVVPLTLDVINVSAGLQAQLQRAGKKIGVNDLYIASTALAMDLRLVTRDKRGFGGVPNLRIESY